MNKINWKTIIYLIVFAVFNIIKDNDKENCVIYKGQVVINSFENKYSWSEKCFKKKMAHAHFGRRIFPSLLAGKLKPFKRLFTSLYNCHEKKLITKLLFSFCKQKTNDTQDCVSLSKYSLRFFPKNLKSFHF